MQAWKMVDATHGDALVAGSIKIGTTIGYAQQEDFRGDKLDSRAQFHMRVGMGSIREHARIMEMYFGSKNVGLMANVTVNEASSPHYALCLSRPGCRYGEQAGKTKRIFRISDVRRLAFLLVRENPDRLSSFDIRPVRYAMREFDAFDPKISHASPFIKRPEFSAEQEIRIIWMPFAPIREPYFISPPSAAIASLISEVRKGDLE